MVLPPALLSTAATTTSRLSAAAAAALADLVSLRTSLHQHSPPTPPLLLSLRLEEVQQKLLLSSSRSPSSSSRGGSRAAAKKRARSLAAAAAAELDRATAEARCKREEAATLRVAALRAADGDAYLNLVAAEEGSSGGGGGGGRLGSLLARTDACLRSLAARLGLPPPPPALQAPPGGGAGDSSSAVIDAARASCSHWDELASKFVATEDELADGGRPQPLGFAGGGGGSGDAKRPCSLSLRPHQLHGVRWAVGIAAAGLNGILADEMGLGKTAQVLSTLLHARALAARRAEAAAATFSSSLSSSSISFTSSDVALFGLHPTLVVVPASLVSNWVSEARKWAPDLVVAAYRGNAEEHAEIWREVKIKRGKKGGRSGSSSSSNAAIVAAAVSAAVAASAARGDGGEGGGTGGNSSSFSSSSSSVEKSAAVATFKPQLRCDVLVTSYEFAMAEADHERLRSVRYGHLIVDEGHRLKNVSAKLSRALRELEASSRLLLTGTPLQNDLGELWSLLNFVLPRAFPDADEFHEWFSGGVRDRSVAAAAAGSSASSAGEDELLSGEVSLLISARLHQVLRPFVLRRRLGEVIRDLPPRNDFLIPVRSSGYQRGLARLLASGLPSSTAAAGAAAANAAAGNNINNNSASSSAAAAAGAQAPAEEPTTMNAEPELIKAQKQRRFSRELRNLGEQPQQQPGAAKSSSLSSSAIGVQNAVAEARNIANHPYLTKLHPLAAEGALSFPSSSASSNRSHPLPLVVRASGKLEALDRLLLALRAADADHRVLVFCTMSRMLPLFAELLERRGLPFESLEGSTPAWERDEAVRRFSAGPSEEEVEEEVNGAVAVSRRRKNHPSAFAFLLTVRAGGVGLNLQAADTVVMYDTDWNPAQDAQAVARAHRLGQEREVRVFRLVAAECAVEGRVLRIGEEKKAAAEAAIDGGYFDGGGTTARERREFLEGLLRKKEGEGGGGGAANVAGGVANVVGVVGEDGGDNSDPTSDAALAALAVHDPLEAARISEAVERRAAAEERTWKGSSPLSAPASASAASAAPAASAAGAPAFLALAPPPPSFSRLLTDEEAAPMVRAAEEAASRRGRKSFTALAAGGGGEGGAEELGRGKRGRGGGNGGVAAAAAAAPAAVVVVAPAVDAPDAANGDALRRGPGRPRTVKSVEEEEGAAAVAALAAAAALAAELSSLRCPELRARFRQLFGFAARSHDAALLRKTIVAGVVEGWPSKPPPPAAEEKKKRSTEEEAPARASPISKRRRASLRGKEEAEVEKDVEEEEAAAADGEEEEKGEAASNGGDGDGEEDDAEEQDPVAAALADLALLNHSALSARYLAAFGYLPRSHDNNWIRRAIATGKAPPALSVAEVEAAKAAKAGPKFPISRRLRGRGPGGGEDGVAPAVEVGAEEAAAAAPGPAVPPVTPSSEEEENSAAAAAAANAAPATTAAAAANAAPATTDAAASLLAAELASLPYSASVSASRSSSATPRAATAARGCDG